MTTGAKRNLCCELAHGEIIAHFDDDDWSAPHRLEQQLKHMAASGKPFVGLHSIYYYKVENGATFQFVQDEQSRPYALGTSMMYRKDYWLSCRFEEKQVGEDGCLVNGAGRVVI
jgi:hypothetical protein